MKLTPILNKILQEKKGDTYKYGCVMLYYKFPEMSKIHNLINKDDLFEKDDDRTYGLEDEPHCTLLYGLKQEAGINEIKDILSKFVFEENSVNKPSLFKNDEYDVLKFDVSGQDLYKCNKELSKLPRKENDYEYHPHLTIGYLKPGKGEEYVKLLKEEKLDSFKLEPIYAVYSYPDGSKEKIKI